MIDEAKQRLKEFREKEGEILINIFENMTSQVEEKYGTDVAMGFALGIDTVYLALTGQEMANMIKEGKAHE